MKPNDTIQLTFDGPGRYRIRIRGFVDQSQADWLGGMQIISQSGPGREAVTTLVGPVADQAALSGVLNALYEMHLPLLSVELVQDDNGCLSS